MTSAGIEARSVDEDRTSSGGNRRVSVLHSFPIWLPLTQTWLYNQVVHAPREMVDSHVVCERLDNLGLFDVPNLFALEREPRLHSIADRALRKLRVRRHLGFQVAVGRSTRAEVLHSHFGNVGWTDAGVAHRLGIPHVVTFYGLDVNKLPIQEPVWRERYAELFAGVARVLCEGPFMARAVVELGCPVEKVRVQRLGVELSRIAYRPREWDGSGALRVLIVGSFREKKGIPDALEAVARVSATRPVEVTIIGDAGADEASTREKARILATIERHRLGARVTLMGYQRPDEVLRQAHAHHVFLSPSITASDGDTEGGAPVTITEMAASGMPVVSTTHCDIPDVVEHGRGALLAPEGDVETLAEHLLWLAGNPGAWASMTADGRARIEEHFDVTKQARQLAGHYVELAAQ